MKEEKKNHNSDNASNEHINSEFILIKLSTSQPKKLRASVVFKSNFKSD